MFKKQNLMQNTFLLMIIALMIAGCSGQQVAPFEATSQLDYHNGYWVTKMDIPDQPVSITAINDMHIDAATNRVTVYAQSRILGKVITPPQVSPGECTESINGDTVCFHPNAVYLNGSGEELMEADGTGAWWVKHAWILGGEGYENCELRPQEKYDDCFWVEGELMEDGLTMKIGGVDGDLANFYNTRTPIFNEDEVAYQVIRFGPKNTDPDTGEIDLTPTEQFVLTWECKEEPSAFDNLARSCPSITE
jgi:hypothetical protein